ncbi:lipopolysaccharide biosynthesis protein [Flavobacterium sp. ZT3R17]|uniref:lipopolysaccharide biosynthesis protein n=1 Tax=Flavobacterium cryoconiti TaxID=3398736 RepID=UPI003A896E55
MHSIIKVLSIRFNNYFAKGHERTVLAKKNIIFSLVLKGVSIAISLIQIPITISYINPAEYGIWLTLSSVVGLFNFFDIGLSNGLKNKLAEANAKGLTTLSNIYISTTYAIISLISITLFFLFFICNFFLDWNYILNVKNDVGTNLNVLALIVFSSFCIQLILQILNSILTAFHALAKVSLVSCIGQVCTLAAILLLKSTISSSLFYLVIILTFTPILVQLFATGYYFTKTYKFFIPSFKMIEFKFAKDLLKIGGLFFFIQLGSLLLFQTDNIVITQLFGPEEVTVFNLCYKLFSVIVMIFTIIMNPFWTAFTDAYVKGDVKWIKNIFNKLYKYWGLLIFVSLVLLVLSPYIFKIWIGDKVHISLGLSFAMFVYTISICWMMIHNIFINGVGKLKLQFYLYIIATVINIPLCVILGKFFGLIGVTVSNIIVVIFMGSVLCFQAKLILNGEAKGIWNK